MRRVSRQIEDEDISKPRIAIVGMGPRGLGALEALAEITQDTGLALKVDVFDPHPAPGTGPNFDPAESPVCRLNIPMRDIEIGAPPGGRIGGFAEWLADPPGADTFPARAVLGEYLAARWADIRSRDAHAITLRPLEVEELRRADRGWTLRAGEGWHGPYAEVLLVLGQPEVAPDDQLAVWRTHTDRSAGSLAQTYPARRLEALASDWAGRTVAIRGLALSAFDVVRVLTVAQGGRFETGRYIASGREPARILPFSLNGMPPIPKPETAALDARFEPTDDETAAFTAALAEAVTAPPDQAQRLIDAALLPAVRRLMREFTGTDEAGIADWLDKEWQAPGSQEEGGPEELLRCGIAISEGTRPPSIGYTVGQVWRKWQDLLRAGFNPASIPAETAAAIVGFDEGLKRYFYGPPVSSSRELAALVDVGIVDLGLATDPEIALVEAGWKLSAGGSSAGVSVMIDAVLPSPDPKAVRGALVAGLLSDGRLRTLGDGLAAHTAADGSLIGTDGAPAPGLCLLGRLALGSVIAADSLHDCFGEASRRWARGVVGRIG